MNSFNNLSMTATKTHMTQLAKAARSWLGCRLNYFVRNSPKVKFIVNFKYKTPT